MQTVNLVSILNAHKALDERIFYKYLNNFGAGDLQVHEVESLQLLVQNLTKCIADQDDDNETDIRTLDEYYMGYCIPQIGKEFDLLKFGIDSVVNIELKKESTKEKVLTQLCRNRYYLSFLGREISCFTYVSDENKLYRLVRKGGKDRLIEVDFSTLYEVLNNITTENLSNIDTLFDPCNYLVSPFNSTEKFVDSKYFLTQQQEQIKNKIIDWLHTDEGNFISLTGSAGTGKTLLVYDIAKELWQKEDCVLIIHCGSLNEGQLSLVRDYDWNIHTVKDGHQMKFHEFDLIIVDEAQRIFSEQLQTIIDKVKKSNRKCVFSYDRKQFLSHRESNPKTGNIIEELSSDTFKLTNKIRTNKKIADFIKQLLDRNTNLDRRGYPNVEVSYFCNDKDAKSQLANLRKNGWKVVNYTPGIHTVAHYERRYNLSNIYDTPHKIIGQEFDYVVGVIDEFFYYNTDGKLEGKNWRMIYSQYGMLYQILTRTRKKIHLVIIKNEEILARCLDVLRIS